MKKMIAILLAIGCLQGSVSPLFASIESYAIPTERTVYLDGEKVFIEGYCINNNNYFKLRDLAAIFRATASQFNVSYNNEFNMIEITTREAYTGIQETLVAGDSQERQRAYEGNSPILVDGVVKALKNYNINGYTYFQLRELADLIGCEVEVDYYTDDILFTRSNCFSF